MYLYFVRNRIQTIPPDLAYAFDSKSFTHVETTSGPLGAGPGMIIAHTSVPSERVRLDAAKQTWRKIPKTDMFCGLWCDDKPTPAELQRTEMIDGHPIELEDGSKWQCAIARGFDVDRMRYYSNLPRSLELDEETGRWLPNQFAPQYRRFMALAIAYAEANEAAAESDETTFSFPDIDELAILGLTCNYRISSIELSMIPDAYSIRVRRQLLDAILDFPTIAAWSKKKIAMDSVGSVSIDGPAALTTDSQAITDPATPK